MRRGDVEQHNFIGAFTRVARRQRSGIAGIHKVYELHALHHASPVNVKAGDNAFSQHVPPFGAHSRKFRKMRSPVSADFSG